MSRTRRMNEAENWDVMKSTSMFHFNLFFTKFRFPFFSSSVLLESIESNIALFSVSLTLFDAVDNNKSGLTLHHIWKRPELIWAKFKSFPINLHGIRVNENKTSFVSASAFHILFLNLIDNSWFLYPLTLLASLPLVFFLHYKIWRLTPLITAMSLFLKNWVVQYLKLVKPLSNEHVALFLNDSKPR